MLNLYHFTNIWYLHVFYTFNAPSDDIKYCSEPPLLIKMEIPENMDDDMKVQAQHIWSMLDDMANKDPSAYRKFIDKQIKEGKEHMKPPEPHMVVQTRIMVNKLFYIFTITYNLLDICSI